MASHNGNDFSSPQEAIEGYLEALLQDVADYEEPEDALQEEPAPIKAKEIEPETAAETVFESETVISHLFLVDNLKMTLNEFLLKYFSSKVNSKIFVQGITPSIETPLEFLFETSLHPDYLLYIIIK